MTPHDSGGFPLTFGTLLRESAKRHPDKAAVVGYRGDTRLALSYGALDRAANRLANALLREGYAKSTARPGRWLAILSPNDVDYPAVHFGAARAGSPLAHVSVRANAAGRAEMLARVKAELLFVHAAYAEEARALLAASATLKRVVVIGGAEGPDSLDAFIGDAPETDPPVAVAPDDPAAVTFSSGSTGEPKGVLVSHRNRALASCLGAQAFELADADVMGCTTPLFHVAGLFMWLQIGIRRGLTVVLLEKWAPDLFADAVARDGVTAAFLVPSQVTALLNDPAAAGRICRADGGKGGGLRHLNISGAPIPSGLLDRALDGLAGPGDRRALRPVGELPARLPAGRLRALEADERRAALRRDGGAGRQRAALARRRNRRGREPRRSHAARLYRRREGLRGLRAGDGWLRTGDIGRIDDDGFLHLIDRARDVIVSGGENIFPAEVERALYRHPAVRECAVFGVPDAQWGEVPAAHVVANGAGAADGSDAPAIGEAALIDFVATQIPRYKRPRFIQFVDTLPRTAIGKIQKNLIRAEYWKGRERAI